MVTKAAATGKERFAFSDLRAKSASNSATLAAASERLAHSSTAITKSVYY